MALNPYENYDRMVAWANEQLYPSLEEIAGILAQPHILLTHISPGKPLFTRRLFMAIASLKNERQIAINFPNQSFTQMVRPLTDQDLTLLNSASQLLSQKFPEVPSPLWVSNKHASHYEKGQLVMASLLVSANKDFFNKK